MNWTVTVYSAILFFVLTPGILVSLPPRGSKFVVAGVHALVFALIYHFTHKFVWRLSLHEGMTGSSHGGMANKPAQKKAAKPIA
jgi:hypothetical protein